MNRPTEPDDVDIRIDPPDSDLGPEIVDELRSVLSGCPDIAFAHLARVTVGGQTVEAQLSLFVWLVPEAVASLRAALNLVCEAVAGALPEDRYLDVLILNSAPELLKQVEEAGTIVVVRDPDERRRALEAAVELPAAESSPARRFRWW